MLHILYMGRSPESLLCWRKLVDSIFWQNTIGILQQIVSMMTSTRHKTRKDSLW